MDVINEGIKKEENSKSKLVLNIILGLSFLIIVCYYIFSSPVRENNVIIHVSVNDTLTKISKELENKKVIRSPFLFKVFVSTFSGDRHIPNGDYLFKKDSNLINIAWQVSRGKHGIVPIKITFKEGITKNEMADILANKISSFRKDLFLSDSRSKEGYLFPDTYFFYPMATTDEILNDLTSNFNKKISSLKKDIENSGHSLSDIIIMASILEKEAGGKDDASIISGILWKRINKGMFLQVDAAPITYDIIGLPQNPISNPGLLFIRAAIEPKDSPYLFYLHDSNGQVHYAEDFNKHRSNIARYLK